MELDHEISEWQAGFFTPNRSCVNQVYTLGKIVQGRKDAGLTNVLFLSRCTEGLRHSMEKWVVEKTMGNRNQRKDVENDEKDDGMCEKCCDAGRGNIEVC